MNTQRSDAFLEKWNSEQNGLKRGSFVVEHRFQTTPEILFPLLCPTTEFDWLPGWEDACELLHSRSGVSEYNVVFRTRFFGAEETWVGTRFEPGKAMEYSSLSTNLASKMDISLADHCDGTVTGRWVITLSALTEEGNEAIDRIGDAQRFLAAVIAALNHYINTGQILPKLDL